VLCVKHDVLMYQYPGTCHSVWKARKHTQQVQWRKTRCTNTSSNDEFGEPSFFTQLLYVDVQ